MGAANTYNRGLKLMRLDSRAHIFASKASIIVVEGICSKYRIFFFLKAWLKIAKALLVVDADFILCLRLRDEEEGVVFSEREQALISSPFRHRVQINQQINCRRKKNGHEDLT